MLRNEVVVHYIKVLFQFLPVMTGKLRNAYCDGWFLDRIQSWSVFNMKQQFKLLNWLLLLKQERTKYV